MSDIPREPQAYRPSDHFIQQFRTRKDPPILGYHINQTIRNGELKEDPDEGNYRFEKRIDGFLWRVVVAVREDRDNLVQTAYAVGVHE